MAVQKALSTERKQKLEVSTKIERGKTVAIIVCVNATGSKWIPFSLFSKQKNKELDLEHAFPLSPDFVTTANGYIQVQEFRL
jgi:hypothetical protein